MLKVNNNGKQSKWAREIFRDFLKIILATLVYLSLLGFLFVFIESDNIFILVMVCLLLILLLITFIKGKFNIYFKLFPIMGLVFLPLILSVDHELGQRLGQERLTPDVKSNLLSGMLARSLNKANARLTYQQDENEKIKIYFAPSLKDQSTKLLSLEPYLTSLNDDYFNNERRNVVSVTLFDDRVLLKDQFNAQNAIGRFINGEIQIFYNDVNANLMQQALVHEYIHALFHEYKNTLDLDIPTWVEEGLAEYSRCELAKMQDEICFKDEQNLKSDIPLTLLVKQSDWETIPDVSSAYYTSYSHVKALIENQGKGFLMQYK